jgi:hypothetical protein
MQEDHYFKAAQGSLTYIARLCHKKQTMKTIQNKEADSAECKDGV